MKYLGDQNQPINDSIDPSQEVELDEKVPNNADFGGKYYNEFD